MLGKLSWGRLRLVGHRGARKTEPGDAGSNPAPVIHNGSVAESGLLQLS